MRFLFFIFCLLFLNSLYSQERLSLLSLSSEPALYLNKKVLMMGNFVFNYDKSCHFAASFFSAPPLRRNDWILSEDGNCIYVTGTWSRTSIKQDGTPIKLIFFCKTERSKVLSANYI